MAKRSNEWTVLDVQIGSLLVKMTHFCGYRGEIWKQKLKDEVTAVHVQVTKTNICNNKKIQPKQITNADYVDNMKGQ